MSVQRRRLAICKQAITIFRLDWAVRICTLLCLDAEHLGDLKWKEIQEIFGSEWKLKLRKTVCVDNTTFFATTVDLFLVTCNSSDNITKTGKPEATHHGRISELPR